MILANQRYDDRLLFENAYDLLSGVWLGSYDSYTLAKGIGYPLFLVLAKKLCLPYSVLLSLLQAAGAWLFVRAVSVRWQNPYGQAILYLLLLFSPSASRCWSRSGCTAWQSFREWSWWYFPA